LKIAVTYAAAEERIAYCSVANATRRDGPFFGWERKPTQNLREEGVRPMNPKDFQEQFVRNLTNCQPSLYGYILSLLPNREDANDVLQDTNLVMWRRSNEYVEGANFTAWAYKIARYKVLALYRDRRRDRHVFDETLFNQLADDAERRVHDPESVAALLDDCVEELPSNQRQLVYDRYAVDGSVQDMAKKLGQSASVLSVTLSRIRHSLMGCVQRKLSGGTPQ
jgi:RNA polymerase sigma-70 factor (ECF subfamily)